MTVEALVARVAQADRNDNETAFIAAATDLLAELEHDRDEGSHASNLDFALLDRLAIAVLEDDPESALRLCMIARTRAGQSDHPIWRVWFTWLGVSACVAMLDFVSAEEVIAAETGLSLREPLPQWLDALESALPHAAGVSETHPRGRDIGTLARLSTARWAAAIGQFTVAERLATLAYQTGAGGLAIEAGIFVAETRLDLGELSSADEILSTCERQAEGAAAERLALLRALWLRDSGRLSEARSVLRGLADSSPSMRVRARWQELDILLIVNRLDEAEPLVEAFEASEDTARASFARAVIAARSATAVGPRSVLELLTPARTSGASGARASWSVSRESARLRDDIARVGNELLLAIHYERTESIPPLTDTLSRWRASTDAPLLRAQCDLVLALADLSTTPRRALNRIARSVATFDYLGLVGLQWNARRVQSWTLSSIGAPAHELEQCRRVTGQLLEEMQASLSPEDRLHHMLSRWSQSDHEARALLDALPTSLADRTSRRQLERTLARIEHSRTWSRIQLDHAEGPSATLERQLFDRRQRRQLIGSRMRWLSPHVALVRYVCLPDRLEGFVLWRGGAHRITAGHGIGRVEVRKRVARLLKYLQRATDWNPSAKPLRRLSEVLGIGELLHVLPSTVHELAIVPDDILFQVPWSVLGGNSDALLERVSVSVLASHGSTWHADRHSDIALPATGLAAPGGKHEAGLAPLENVDAELEALASVRPELTALGGPKARVEHALEGLCRPGPMHFACHGIFDPDSPAASGLVLHDGRLTLESIMLLGRGPGTAPSIVTLSACWGANMAHLPGRELVGLPQGLLSIGCDHVIASLWAVADLASPEFVRRLYAHLDEAPVPEALRRAQLESMRAGQPASDWGCYLDLRAAAPVRTGYRWWVRLRSRWWPLHGRRAQPRTGRSSGG